MVVKSPLLSYLEGIDMYRLSSGADKVTCDAGLLQSYDNIDYQIHYSQLLGRKVLCKSDGRRKMLLD